MSNTKVSSEQIIDDVALGGNPTTTTQSAGNNTTRVATTAFVTTAINNLVDSSPDALNTLNELAAALNDDANFSTTVTNSIATKVALSGSGQTIADSGNLTLDAAGDIILDADGADLIFKDGGTEIGRFINDSTDFKIAVSTLDKDLKFTGNDGGNSITALTFDMSDGGKAIFGSAAQFASDINIEAASGNPSLTIKTAGTGNNPHINYRAGDNTIFDTMAVFSESTNYWRVAYGSSGSVANNLFVVDETGNAGIGLTNPTGKLEIATTGTNAAPHIKLVESGDTREFNIYNDGSGNGRLVLADSDDDTPDTEIVLADNGVLQFKTANTERLAIDATGLDVAGIIDNTRDNQNISAPNNSDHTAGTRIKFYDNTADSWYAMGISGNTMWFKADDEFAWYDGANNAIKMKLDANGDLQRPYGIYARGFWNFGGTGSVNSGTTAIYNNNNRITITSGKIYVPVAGRYLVHVQGLDNSAGTSFDTRIQHNVTGSNDAFLADLRLGTNGGGTHGSSSATSVVDMAANDYIHILRLSGTQYAAASSTSPHNSWFITYLG